MVNKCLMVLGPPRSGTSLVTHLLGRHFDGLPFNLFPNDSINPSGYWEPMPIVDAHQQLLSAMKLNWQSPQNWNLGDISKEQTQDFKLKLWYEFTRNFAGSRIPVLKDPRISRLAPLWFDIFYDQQVWVGCVVVHRPYHQVVKSLLAAWGMPTKLALQIWCCYTLDAEYNSRQVPRVFIDFEHAMQDQKQVLEMVFSNLGEFLRDFAKIPDDIAAIVKPELVHHQQADAEEFEASEWLDFAKEIDQILQISIVTGVIDTNLFDTIRDAFYARIATDQLNHQ